MKNYIETGESYGNKNQPGNPGIYGGSVLWLVSSAVYLRSIRLRRCRRALFFVPPLCGDGNDQLDLYAGGISLCPHRICEIPRVAGRKICVGLDQKRDPYAEISGVPVRESLLRTDKR